MSTQMFSIEQATVEQAQALHKFNLFEPAAVFQAPSGQYVMGKLREMNWPPHQTAKGTLKLGYKMVSACDPVCGVWSKYEEPK